MHKVSLVSITAPLKNPRTYTVQPGDTAKSIAMAFFRNPLEARRIEQTNGPIVAGKTITL